MINRKYDIGECLVNKYPMWADSGLQYIPPDDAWIICDSEPGPIWYEYQILHMSGYKMWQSEKDIDISFRIMDNL